MEMRPVNLPKLQCRLKLYYSEKINQNIASEPSTLCPIRHTPLNLNYVHSPA